MRTSPPKKRDRLPTEKLLPQMPRGVERPRNVGEKSIGDGSCEGKYFFVRWHVRLRGPAERSVGGTLYHLHKTFYRSPRALACGGSRGYLT
jgi:hypothetical protein